MVWSPSYRWSLLPVLCVSTGESEWCGVHHTGGHCYLYCVCLQVRVNGVEYVPSATCANKKLAKAQAAAICLQEMGLIPRDFVVQA